MPTVKSLGTYEHCPIYHDGDHLSGSAILRIRNGHSLDHSGIVIEFKGAVVMPQGADGRSASATITEFVSMSVTLKTMQESPIGDVRMPFDFGKVRLPYESYDGDRVTVRYYFRVLIKQSMTDAEQERTIWVLQRPPAATPTAREPIPAELEVGLEEFVHIKITLDDTVFDSFDAVVSGWLYFFLVKIKIVSAEMSLTRREVLYGSTSPEASGFCERDVIARLQIVEGPPYKGDSIPFRFPLGAFKARLTPSYSDVNKLFALVHCVNVVLLDEQGRKYFKQQPVSLRRSTSDLCSTGTWLE